jgi:hypothetical protein
MNLSGEWVGYYPGHFDEFIRINQIGDEVEAVKVTGDDNVPAGAVTWRANVKTGIGVGQIAEKEYRNARFIPGKLTILSPERITFAWDKAGQVAEAVSGLTPEGGTNLEEAMKVAYETALRHFLADEDDCSMSSPSRPAGAAPTP